MAFVDLPGGCEWPYIHPLFFNANNIGLSTTLDAAADWMAFLIHVPKTGTLNNIWFRQTQQTSIQDLHISFQNVNNAGDPDGTVDEFRVVTPVGGDLNNYVSSGIISSDGTDVGTKRSVTKGDKLAIVFKFNSTAGDIDILSGHNKTSGSETYPAVKFSTNSGSTWSDVFRFPTFMLEYVTDGIVYVPGVWPSDAITDQSVSSTSSPDEIGIKFQVKADVKVSGVILGGARNAVEIEIEDGSKVNVAGPVTNIDNTDATTGAKRQVMFASAVTLSADTDYYLLFRPTTTSSNILRYMGLQSATHRAAFPFGTTQSWNTRTDDGTWTENTDRIGVFALIVEQVDTASGGASNVFSPQIIKPVTSGPVPIY
jgi:hypothetical protein